MRKRVRHRFCSPELNLWVSSLLLLTAYPEKGGKKGWTQMTVWPFGGSQSFILSDSSLCCIKSFNPRSLYGFTYMSKWKSWHFSWFLMAFWSIFLIRWRWEGRQITSKSLTLSWLLESGRQQRNFKVSEIQFLPPATKYITVTAT